MYFQINTTSWTGNLIYSDVYRVQQPNPKYPREKYPDDFSYHQEEVPFLNKWASVPLFGRVAGIVRVVLALIHILGHLLASLFTADPDHLKHVVKGGTEVIRGCIEALPIVGEIFSWKANKVFGCGSEPDKVYYYAFFFLVKLTNIQKPDKVDAFLVAQKRHAFSDKMENHFALEHEKVLLPILDQFFRVYEECWREVSDISKARYDEKTQWSFQYLFPKNCPKPVEVVKATFEAFFADKEAMGMLTDAKLTHYRQKIDLDSKGSDLSRYREIRNNLFELRMKDFNLLKGLKGKVETIRIQQILTFVEPDLKLLVKLGAMSKEECEGHLGEFTPPSVRFSHLSN